MEAAQELYSLRSELVVTALIKFDTAHVSRTLILKNAETVNLDQREYKGVFGSLCQLRFSISHQPSYSQKS
jgi:hypothetical protein